jgi:protein-S-isoprenylcysteine O-methyltransferase Ste14
MALFLTGEFLLWGSNPRGALAYLVTFGVAVTLFVLLYEEPVLRRKFPEDYSAYFRSVPRFLPRLSPWNPEKSKGANSAD